jgi:hypothetical protein
MKAMTKRVMAGGASILATATIVSAATLGTVSAHGKDNGDSRGNHGKQFDGSRIQAYFDLDTALHQHAALGLNALKTTAFATPDAEAAKTALDDNSKAIADQVEKLYPGTHDQFLDLWNKHIGYYTDYLNAAKAGDAAAKEQAVANLATFAKDTDNLLDGKMHTLNKDKNHGDMDESMGALEKQLTTHTNQTIAAIDQLVAGDYDAMYKTGGDAYNHMEILARSMAGIWFKGMPKHMEWQ